MSKLPKWSRRQKKKAHEWAPPETPLDESEFEPVYVVGAMVSSVHVDTRNREEVEMILGAATSEVLDQAGKQRIDWYRVILPVDNPIVQAFFGRKPVTASGEYRNPQFQIDVVIEGTLIGHDSNPDEIGRGINVVRGDVVFLEDAMAATMQQSTEGLTEIVTTVPLSSQLAQDHEYPAGTRAVILSTTTDEETLLIEVQADGLQECLEVPRSSVREAV